MSKYNPNDIELMIQNIESTNMANIKIGLGKFEKQIRMIKGIAQKNYEEKKNEPSWINEVKKYPDVGKPYPDDLAAEALNTAANAIQRKIDDILRLIERATDPEAIKTLKEYAGGLMKAKEIIQAQLK